MDEKVDVENNKDLFVLKIPGAISSKTIVFKNHFVECNGKKIYYKDVTAVAYNTFGSGINYALIPIWRKQSYKFYIASDQEKIKLTLSAAMYIGNKEKQDNWLKLIELCKQLIEPLLVSKIAKKVFENNKMITIAGVHLNDKGYFVEVGDISGSSRTAPVFWSEKMYTPQFLSGDVILYKDVNGKERVLARIPMETPNAVILPELLNACKNEYEKRS